MSKSSGYESSSVLRAYARWAPVYDVAFGAVANSGRRQAVEHINNRRGRVLEAGVGTGISLPHYKSALKIAAIDLSPDMLSIARGRVEKHGLDHVEEVREMDAAHLDYEDGRFDVVVAMYVLTTVPDPERVMAELERVCAPGGEVIVVNHFKATQGLRGRVEARLAPFAATLGWRPDFAEDRILGQERLRLVERRALKPFGLFTMLRFVRQTEPARGEPESRQSPARTRARAARGRPVPGTRTG